VYFYTNGKELFSRPEPWAQDGETFFGAQVTVMRKGMPDTVFFARHDAYVATYRKGGVEHVNSMWQKRGPEQTAKCAFSGALREAFPEDLAGLYSNEEMARVIDDEREDKPETAYVPQPPVAVPHIVVPTMSTAPATVEGNKPLDAIVAPKSLNDDISTWAPVDDPMLPSGAVVPTADNPAAFEPTEAQLLARAALKSVPAHKLAEFDRIVPDAKAKMPLADPTTAPQATAAPATPSTTVASAPPTASVPSTGEPTQASSDVPIQVNDAVPTQVNSVAENKPANLRKPEPLDKAGRDIQYARATKFCADVLTPEPPKGGGMKASKGQTVTAKLKKFFLSQTTKGTDLAALSLSDWEMTWVVLEARLREYGAEKLVSYIESKI
jgi:hypothetical protein